MEIPIAPGTHDLAELGAVAVTVRNTSATDPAAVTITGPDGEVWACELGPDGEATFSQGIAPEDLPAGRYTITVAGTVVGTLST